MRRPDQKYPDKVVEDRKAIEESDRFINARQRCEDTDVDGIPVRIEWDTTTRFYLEIVAIRRGIARDIAAAVRTAIEEKKKVQISSGGRLSINIVSEESVDEHNVELGCSVTFISQKGRRCTLSPVTINLHSEPLCIDDEEEYMVLSHVVPVHVGFSPKVRLRKDFFPKFSAAFEHLEEKVRQQLGRLYSTMKQDSPIYVMIQNYKKIKLEGRTILRLQCDIYYATKEEKTMTIPMSADFDYDTL